MSERVSERERERERATLVLLAKRNARIFERNTERQRERDTGRGREKERGGERKREGGERHTQKNTVFVVFFNVREFQFHWQRFFHLQLAGVFLQPKFEPVD